MGVCIFFRGKMWDRVQIRDHTFVIALISQQNHIVLLKKYGEERYRVYINLLTAIVFLLSHAADFIMAGLWRHYFCGPSSASDPRCVFAAALQVFYVITNLFLQFAERHLSTVHNFSSAN